MKFRLFFCVAIAQWLTNSALAQEIYPHEGSREEPPYLLRIHGCSFKDATASNRYIPVSRSTDYQVLVVSPSRYSKIKSSVNKEIIRSKEANSELKKANKKVNEFEDSGNIQAMEHWARKAAAIELDITRGINQRLLPKSAQEIIVSESPPVYYSRSKNDKYRTNTLQELIDATDDNCTDGIY